MTKIVQPTFDQLIRSAHAFRVHGQRGQMISCLAQAKQRAEGNADKQAVLAQFYCVEEDYPSALKAYDQAVRLAPTHVGFRYDRAAVRRFLGQLDGAEEDLDAVIFAAPGDSEAWHLRSDLRVQTSQRNHVAALQARIEQGFEQWQDEVPIRFALAKELEDLGEHGDSWSHLHRGATLRRQFLHYDVRIDLSTVDWICEAFPDTRSGDSTDLVRGPIFIVGMPRTGTSLLERLICQHSNVHAAGELPHFAHAVVASVQSATKRKDLTRAELVSASARIDFRSLGESYLHRAAAHVGGRDRFIDKMPLNYLYCALIHSALPGARILHVTRHPMATGYAVYKTLFARGYPFSYDLSEIAEYYCGYRRLMAHWHSTMPGVILDVSYENLVTDPVAECRKVFRFCGIDWQQRNLTSNNESWRSTTASASQIRRPIYQSSIELWRHYEQQLQPLAKRMREIL